MQSASHLPSWSYHHQIQWEAPRIPEPHIGIQKSVTSRPMLVATLRTPTALHSLKTCKFKFDDFGECQEHKELVPLPIVIRRSGGDSRYVWDGSRLQLVGFDQTPSNCSESENGFFQLLHSLGLAVRKMFVPQQVQGNYMDYVKWKFFHRVFSSALQVLATQAMFRAIGFGSSYSLSSAAAMNWVLKDGLGRLSRCIYTAYMGCSFDTNLKRVRFSTSVLFSLSIGVELLTPAFPQHFLLLATISNIAKSISLAAYLATGSAIHRSFAIADNLGEVSAKAQVQTVCFDNLGLLLAVFLNMLSKNNTRIQAGLPFIIYPIFATMDLFAIYRGLKHVHLQTLTKDRLEIIIEEWIQSGHVPPPAEVSNKEGIDFIMGKGRKLWPIRIGCIDIKDPSQTSITMTMSSLIDEGLYFICMESFVSGLMRKRNHGILLCLQESTGTSDIIMGLLQACHIRKTLLLSRSRWDSVSEGTSTEISTLPKWFRIVQDSKTCTLAETNLLTEEIRRSGWALKNILLSSQEQMSPQLDMILPTRMTSLTLDTKSVFEQGDPSLGLVSTEKKIMYQNARFMPPWLRH